MFVVKFQGEYIRRGKRRTPNDAELIRLMAHRSNPGWSGTRWAPTLAGISTPELVHARTWFHRRDAEGFLRRAVAYGTLAGHDDPPRVPAESLEIIEIAGPAS